MAQPQNTLIELTVSAAARVLRNGELSAETYAEALIEQASQCAHLNAFISYDPAAVLKAARQADCHRQAGRTLGPLHGVPLAIKDNIDTSDLPTTAGTAGLRNNRPRRNATVVQRLLDNGAILFGKNNMHELAYGVTTNNGTFGPSRNPYDPGRVPGGSSGGTGTAVGARIVPGGIGTDTGASIRLPSAFCGGVGFRPSIGRWPQQGLVPAASTRDTAGPMTRSVADCVLLDGIVTAGPTEINTPPLSGLRLGLPRAFFWEDLDPEVDRVLEEALLILRDAGVIIVEGGELPDMGILDMQLGFTIAGYEMVAELARYLADHELAIDLAGIAAAIASPEVKQAVQGLLAAPVSRADYDRAIAGRAVLQENYRRYFADMRVDAFLMPTCPLLAPLISNDDIVFHNGRELPLLQTAIRSLNPGSVAGIPGLSIPAGLSRSGLPIGLALDGPFKFDQRLLAIGQALESVLPSLPAPKLG